ncbi:hypothetical protein C8Q80DRAFT_882075 [Daedaleopsis nitida]|nr:hypothetical protein C8Q80DRAFT_882075 [Daedaleopsis nitida]
MANTSLENTCAAIEACGKDPKLVILEEMETCRVRLVCTTCVSSKPDCEALDWKAGAYHIGFKPDAIPYSVWSLITGGPGKHAPTFQLLDEEHTTRVKLLEAAAVENAGADAAPTYFNIYGCAPCRRRLKAIEPVRHCTALANTALKNLNLEWTQISAYRFVPNATARGSSDIPQGQTTPAAVADIVAQRAFDSPSLFPSS